MEEKREFLYLILLQMNMANSFSDLFALEKNMQLTWVNDVRHYNMEFKGHHEGKCLKGKPGEKCECEVDEKPCRG